MGRRVPSLPTAAFGVGDAAVAGAAGACAAAARIGTSGVIVCATAPYGVADPLPAEDCAANCGRAGTTGCVSGSEIAGCAPGVGSRVATAAIAWPLGRPGVACTTAGELSVGVPNADCTTPADAGVTMTGNVPPLIAIMPPHTEQRARTPLAGTFAGSTRNTERQSGQPTVIVHHPNSERGAASHAGTRRRRRTEHRAPAERLPLPPQPHHGDDPAPTRNPGVSLRNSSSR